MENNVEKPNKEDVPIYKVLKQIKEGILEAKDLSKEMRQECVEVLYLEGHNIATIAQLLDRSTKTIKRDLEDIWQKNSKNPTFVVALAFIAELVGKSKAQQAHLMRMSRSNEGTIQERSQAEYLAWKIQSETVERLQSLGYLPTAAQKIQGDIYHHQDTDDGKTLEQLEEELSLLERLASDNGILDDAVKAKIKSLQLKIEQAEITQQITGLAKEQNNRIQDKEQEDSNVKQNE